MPIKVFLNPTGQWNTPWMEQLASQTVEATEDSTLIEVAKMAVAQSAENFDPNWIWLVTRPDEKGRQSMGYLPAVIDDEGILRWLPEGPGGVTIREFNRTQEAGLFDGDPNAICAEHMLGGNGVFPGWEELLEWLVNAAAAGAVGVGLKKLGQLIRRRYQQWQGRGARSPFAFLDVVLAREDWARGELDQLLQIASEEAHELLDILGYDLDTSTNRYVLSSDDERGRLRRRIIEDFLRRQPPES